MRRFRTLWADEPGRWGNSGSDCVGGGAAGACEIFVKAGGSSVTVDNEVAAVGGFDPCELCHVREVTPLESDSRGTDGCR